MPSSRRQKADVQKFDRAMRPNAPAGGDLQWFSPREAPFELVGFAWYKKDRVFRRMPLKPKHRLPEAVDHLANNTAGGQIRIATDSSKLSIRVKLAAPAGMVHMPATGQCGFDCYLGSGTSGKLLYLSTTKYDVKLQSYDCVLFDLPGKEMRQVTMNFPLYQGVLDVELGLDTGAAIAPPAPFTLDRPVVFYGTSITQGGCATRPGMAYTNILSRRLNIEAINLGFSGSGKGEPEVAHTIATIPDPACLVLDYEANAGVVGIKETLKEFIRILRAAHPEVPILVVSRVKFAGENFRPSARDDRLNTRDFQRDTVAALRKKDPRLFFHDGGNLLGDDFDETTVDGVHPTDLGFIRIAEGLEPVLRTILGLSFP